MLAKERSGEVVWPFVGTLVGLSSFIVARLELLISSARSRPLALLIEECHRVSCALRSPRMRRSFFVEVGGKGGIISLVAAAVWRYVHIDDG